MNTGLANKNTQEPINVFLSIVSHPSLIIHVVQGIAASEPCSRSFTREYITLSSLSM